MRKIIKRIFWLVLVLIILFGVNYCWRAFPIISGYGAKNLCSAIYLQHRNPKEVIKEDLGDFPISLGSYTINEKDSSVTATVWGLAKKKAIYRKGIGCTLINDFSEEQIRSQQFIIPNPPLQNTDTIPWPYGDKLVDTIPSSINLKELNNTLENTFKELKNNKPTYTRAILVIYNGQIIAEKYADGFDKNTVMLGWSVSKSFMGALIGILVKEGKLNVSEQAPVPEWRDNDKKEITLENLLQQTSGLDFKESYTSPSEVTNMLFKKGDMAAFTANRELQYKPGTVFNYSSGNSNILSRIIRHAVGEKDYAAFPYQYLFHKINMHSMLLEPDASGTYIGSSYSYATARDFARFGLLYYNNGIWNGEQILPVNWVIESVKPSGADPQKHYGYQFWLNGFDKNNPSKHIYPDVPGDMFYADGYGGQDIYIIPSKKLVVVRLGLHVIDENKMLKEIIASVQ
ncbi:MAG: serine hydrolase domain-containing protein [Ginsengibacter sp.]